MFQFSGSPSAYLWIQYAVTEVCSAGFPHSDICGSLLICSSPQLFAAYHVFLRLLVPRHPSCALSGLTFHSYTSVCIRVSFPFLPFLRVLFLLRERPRLINLKQASSACFINLLSFDLWFRSVFSFQGASSFFIIISRCIFSSCTARYYLNIVRHPPVLPCRLQHSTFGRLWLNRRVRYGYGCFP